MKQSKKYKEYKNDSIQNLVNHAQGDKELASQYEEGQEINKKLGKNKKEITTRNNMY
ncbi:hypothetical protein QOZ84_07690 [Romboutsia sedimentorum]|uniref:Uncharacterized protein n=1 Tax=Romboutsia sedimentorum TaxID=1368474 RepID=A0ABT7E927_9FIRM|nr:hypothetical protein [Romboutsia sedimentorum]MDK2563429.1 hypothetical protein [Romboutsia sedimentorum]MDK2585152.1 hypothetical protein [Romboutsia sedimentorum]